MNSKLIASLVLTGLIIVFIIQNAGAVEIQFLFWKFALSQALLVFFVLAIGVATGWIGRAHFVRRKGKEE